LAPVPIDFLIIRVAHRTETVAPRAWFRCEREIILQIRGSSLVV
jgi:hypothetical protein